MSDTVLERLLGHDSAHIERFKASELDIRGHSSDPIRFSMDGEVIQARDLSLSVRPGILQLVVGEGYEPAPGDT